MDEMPTNAKHCKIEVKMIEIVAKFNSLQDFFVYAIEVNKKL